ncbi:hypothetical protein FH5T_03740 [Draconibacterium orientale]|uniref:Uncharacterized protein n=1 Tax=Draconibacterium orientale TaxID=1168034 RepID=A0ABN4D2E3_9BACT|nr:hypothetical protein FH5T_03740 [Draconibacterium orientale]
MKVNKCQPLTKCKCNAGGRGFPAFSPCSTTANPSLTDDGLKKKFSATPAWLRANLTSCRFKAPHSTCTNRCTQY